MTEDKDMPGMYHGTGTYLYPDGKVYEGQWSYNQHHGLGCLTYANGSIFSGNFVANKKHGPGSFYEAGGNHQGESHKRTIEL